MSEDGAPGAVDEERALRDATGRFHDALLQAHRVRSDIGGVEAAAAHYCQVLRGQGCPPERMLVEAKRVIEEAIDGEDVRVAERAVQSCIQHYYRT